MMWNAQLQHQRSIIMPSWTNINDITYFNEVLNYYINLHINNTSTLIYLLRILKTSFSCFRRYLKSQVSQPLNRQISLLRLRSQSLSHCSQSRKYHEKGTFWMKHFFRFRQIKIHYFPVIIFWAVFENLMMNKKMGPFWYYGCVVS